MAAAVVAAPVGLLALGLGAAVGVSAAQRHLHESKAGIARERLSALGDGMAQCAVGRGFEVPRSTDWIPSGASLVAGKTVFVPQTDWYSQRAFECSGFAPNADVSFQYRWHADGERIGKAVARADLDGDGHIDQQLSVVVTCGSGRCSASSPIAEAVDALPAELDPSGRRSPALESE